MMIHHRLDNSLISTAYALSLSLSLSHQKPLFQKQKPNKSNQIKGRKKIC
jgi:hypothetical protein